MMSRCPLAVLGFSVFAALTVAAGAGPRAALALAAACGGMGAAWCIGFAVWRRKRASAPGRMGRALAKAPFFAMVFMAMAFAFCSYHWAWNAKAAPAQELDGLECQVRLLILDYPDERYGRYYYRAQTKAVDGDTTRQVELLLSAAEPILCRPYSMVECPVRFYRFSQDGLYSTQNRRWASGAMIGASLAGSAKSWPAESWPVDRLLAEFRRSAGRSLSRLLPGDCAGLLRTVLLGQRWGLSSGVYGDFSRIGCSHMLAVSGLHMGALTAFFSLLVARLPLRRIPGNLLKGAALILYMCLTGFPVSAVRSGLMYLVYLLADSLGRPTYGVNSLGAAVLAVCLSNPFSGGDLGFALSAMSTLGILTVQKGIYRGLIGPCRRFPLAKRLLGPAAQAASVTFAATLFTLPIQIGVFGGLPLLAPLANLLLLPLIALLLYSSVILMALAPFPVTAPLVQPLVFFCGWLTRGILWIAHQLARIPGGFLTLRDSPWVWVLPLSAAVTFYGWRRGRDRLVKAKALALALCFILCTGIIQLAYWQGVATVLIGGSPENPCVLVVKEGRAAALSLGGYNSSFAGNLLSAHNAVFLESVLLPVQSPQARAMAVELLTSRSPSVLVLPAGAYAGKDLTKPRVPVVWLEEDSPYEALPGVWVQLGQEGKCLRAWVNGRRLLVELDRCQPERGDFLVTGSADSQMSAALRILLDQEETCAAFQEASPGYYLLADENTAACLRIFPDGSFREEPSS